MTKRSTDPPEQPGSPTESMSGRERCGPGDFFCVMIGQLLVLAMIAPGDGGRWLRHVLPLAMAGNLIVYLALLRDGSRRPRHAGHWAAVLAAVAAVTGLLVTTWMAFVDLR